MNNPNYKCLKYNSLLIAIGTILICEILGRAAIKNSSLLQLVGIADNLIVNSLIITLIVRLSEIGFMLIIIDRIASGLLSGVGNFGFQIEKENFIKGVKIGFLWSFYFAIVAFIGVALIILITHTNPILFFKSPIISKLVSSSNLSQNNKQFILTIFMLTSCIVSPFAEELFFRGFIYSFFRKYGVIKALIITTFLFVISHLSGIRGILNVDLIIPLIGGVIFALSYEYSKNLAAPIIIHSLGNSAIFTISIAFNTKLT